MKKICTLTALLLAVIMILASCGNKAEAPDGMKALESTDNSGYNIYIPELWHQGKSDSAVTAYAADNSNITMASYDITEAYENGDAYIEAIRNEIQNTFSNVEWTSETADILLGGNAAKRLEYKAKVGNEDLSFMQIITVKSMKEYIFTYTAKTENYEGHKAEVQLIVDNFSFN